MKDNKQKQDAEENDTAMENDAAIPDEVEEEITQKSKKKRKS